MILFLCASPVQILRTIQLHMRVDEFKGESEICICDTFGGADEICERIKELNIFDSTSYLRISTLNKHKILSLPMEYYFPLSEFTKKVKRERYETIVSFNIASPQSFLAYNAQKNKGMTTFIYGEDAPNIYDYHDVIPNEHGIVVNRLFRLNHPIFNASRWYFSVPEKMQRLNDAPAVKMPQIAKNDYKLIEVLNHVFQYKLDQNIENADVIILGECFNVDGRLQNQDIVFYETLIKAFPDVRFALKPHPRERSNRFEQLCKVIESKGIPWELYALNENIENKILTSICSSCLISPKLVIDVEPRCLLLFNILKNEIKLKEGGEVFTRRYIELIRSLPSFYDQKERFVLPETKMEYYDVFSKWTQKTEEGVND